MDLIYVLYLYHYSLAVVLLSLYLACRIIRVFGVHDASLSNLFELHVLWILKISTCIGICSASPGLLFQSLIYIRQTLSFLFNFSLHEKPVRVPQTQMYVRETASNEASKLIRAASEHQTRERKKSGRRNAKRKINKKNAHHVRW